MFEGSQIQNAIYIVGRVAAWPIAAGDWEARAREVLEPGAVRLHRGRRRRRGDDAREPRGVRAAAAAAADARREHRARHRRSRCSARRSPAPFFLAPIGVLSIAHPDGELAVARAAAATRRPVHPLERGVALDRGDRRGDGRRAALVPALLGQRPRDLRELRRARRGGRLRRDRRHARHADRSAGGRATCAARTSRSSAARAARSSSPTRSSARGSTRRPRRTR